MKLHAFYIHKAYNSIAEWCENFATDWRAEIRKKKKKSKLNKLNKLPDLAK